MYLEVNLLSSKISNISHQIKWQVTLRDSFSISSHPYSLSFSVQNMSYLLHFYFKFLSSGSRSWAPGGSNKEQQHQPGIQHTHAASITLSSSRQPRWRIPMTASSQWNYLMTKVCEWVSDITFENYYLTNLEYIDDATLFSNSVNQLGDTLTIHREESAKLGLQGNWAKTKLMLEMTQTLLVFILTPIL